MRKIILFLAALLFMAVPAMAASTVTLTSSRTVVGDVNWVTVSYNSDVNRIRAFGLDITVLGPDGNAIDPNIMDVCDVNSNYRIYPGTIDFVNGDINSTGYGTPYDPCDLHDHNNTVVVEMGSLYTTDANYAGDANAGYNKIPPKSGTLFKFAFKNGCYYRVDVNARRGGIVMEDPYETPTLASPLCDANICCPCGCPVPDVRGETLAAANVDIIAANLVTGPNVPEVNCATANGNVTRTDPVNGFSGTCGVTSVTKYYAQNPAAPGAAFNMTPVAGANCVSITQVLSWSVGSDTNTQDIYFGTNSTPPLVVSGAPVSQTTYNPGALNVYTLYRWRVDERNVCGVVTTGTVNCFTTGPTAGKPCCSNDPVTKCLGNINYASGNTRVDNVDIGLLVTYLSGQIGYRCTPAVGSTACPPCFDINGSGRVDNTDIGLLITKVSGFASNRHTCPYPSCTNP